MAATPSYMLVPATLWFIENVDTEEILFIVRDEENANDALEHAQSLNPQAGMVVKKVNTKMWVTLTLNET